MTPTELRYFLHQFFRKAILKHTNPLNIILSEAFIINYELFLRTII